MSCTRCGHLYCICGDAMVKDPTWIGDSWRSKHERETLVRVVRHTVETLIEWTEGHASDLCMCLWCVRLRDMRGLLPV